MRARVPNFVKANKANKVNRIVDSNSNYASSNYISSNDLHKRISPALAVAPLSSFHQARGSNSLYQHLPADHHQFNMWHSKSHDNGISKETLKLIYLIIQF